MQSEAIARSASLRTASPPKQDSMIKLKSRVQASCEFYGCFFVFGQTRRLTVRRRTSGMCPTDKKGSRPWFDPASALRRVRQGSDRRREGGRQECVERQTAGGYEGFSSRQGAVLDVLSSHCTNDGLHPIPASTTSSTWLVFARQQRTMETTHAPPRPQRPTG